MNQVITKGIILSRTNFGEADRIITMLTPDHGKRRLMAKGVRKERSKLAGGIELFSVSNITFIPGRGDIDTLISTRLIRHYGHIVENVERTMLGYELLKRLNRATEAGADAEYFVLLQSTFDALDTQTLNGQLVETWFNGRLLKLAGHQPNLTTDATGAKLAAQQTYSFDIDKMAFAPKQQGRYQDRHIKLLRLLFGVADPQPLQNIKDAETVLPDCQQLMSSLLKTFIRI